jgi:CRISPR-associated endonuclease/helicase Cas3
VSAAPPPTLLAKSPRGASSLSLRQHCGDTEEAAVHLFAPTVRWGRAWRRFFRLEDTADGFFLNLRVAALFHDLGKANEDFYRAVSKPGFHAQSLRHEHLSALVLQLPEVEAWLSTNPRIDRDVITAAVLSHHCKAGENGEWEWCQARGLPLVRMYLQHAEVRSIFARVAEVAGLGAPPSLPTAPWEPKDIWADALSAGRKRAKRFERALRGDAARRNLTAAVKAAVIAADGAASGLVREGHSIKAWIAERADVDAIAHEEIDTKIIAPRIQQVERQQQVRDPAWRFALHRFQLGAAEQGPRAVLLAACGTGKTLAAWKWAEAQARTRSIGKVVFLYPTRATATEGFRDYVSWAPEADASLVHGTARYELDAIARNPSETPSAAGRTFSLSQEDDRLYSLGYWSRRFFSATVDQFLGFMEHAYKGLCMLPVLADSAVIIDEVHSFDENMFKNLVAFLKAFDVPVLCMTATLQPSRLRELIDAGLAVYPRDKHRADLPDLALEEEAPRYRIATCGDAEAAYAHALAAYREGLRVLWVVNTVDRCQELARRLSADLRVEVDAYHSRFKLSHRQEVHGRVVRAFQQRTRAAIAVTTQVCEMSLDLDADVLLTELAPVPSLVQRFGRSNRKRAGKPADFRARVWVYEPPRHKPYERADLEAARRFLAALGDGEVSQRRLAECLAQFAPGEARADDFARFLDSGYYATTGSLRDLEEFNESCVLDGDLAAIEPCVVGRTPWDGFVVPVPKGEVLGDDARPAWLPKWVGLARSSRYESQYGYVKGGTEG